MDVIDDDGNLFGLVNVIDALVVLLLLAVLVAGIALLDPFTGPGEPATRYATVDLGTQPEYVAAQISAGDELVDDADGNLTVTDVYVTPDDGTDARVLARVELHGALTGEPTRFSYAGERLQQGDGLTIETSDYAVSGNVTRLEETGASLPVEDTSVTFETTVRRPIADEITEGDTVEIAGHEVATLTTVEIGPGTTETPRRVTLGASLQTYKPDGRLRFGNRSVTIGSTIELEMGEYALAPQLTAVGNDRINTTQTDVVLESTVPTTTADSMAVGDTYRIRDTTVATIESVQSYPTDNPARKHVIAGLTLQTITRDDTPQFAGSPVKLGTSIPFSTSDYDFTGAVVRVDGHTPPGEVSETTATIKLENVTPEIVEGVKAGMTETRGGVTFATIERRDVENATVVLESEDGNIYRREHPVNKDVYLEVSLRTRRTDSGLTFHARSLQEDTDVVLDLGSITIEGTVIELES